MTTTASDINEALSRISEKKGDYLADAVWIADLAIEGLKPEPLVVSTIDGRVRTGVTERTVANLSEVIAGYVADGYTLEELVIVGVTE